MRSTKVIRRRLSSVVLALGMLSEPVGALADCALGKAPTYDDITGVAVIRCGRSVPMYHFSVIDDGVTYFTGRYKSTVVGAYSARDGKPLLASLIEIFEKARLLRAPPEATDGLVSRRAMRQSRGSPLRRYYRDWQRWRRNASVRG